jgi:hypothetical protein
MEQRTMYGPCEECRQQIADAEREMAAFVAAVARHSGPVAAVRAAEHWVELAESMNPTLVDGRPIWRELTIMALKLIQTTSTGRGLCSDCACHVDHHCCRRAYQRAINGRQPGI